MLLGYTIKSPGGGLNACCFCVMYGHDLEFPVIKKLQSLSADAFFNSGKQNSQIWHWPCIRLDNTVLCVSVLCSVGFLVSSLFFSHLMPVALPQLEQLEYFQVLPDDPWGQKSHHPWESLIKSCRELAVCKPTCCPDFTESCRAFHMCFSPCSSY